jgi:5-methylcytosine-specific restriction endonuclease McrA
VKAFYDRHPRYWEAIATAVKERAGWRCVQCGAKQDLKRGITLGVHHIDGNTYNLSDENLIALCCRCHLRAQGKPWTLNPKQVKLGL